MGVGVGGLITWCMCGEIFILNIHVVMYVQCVDVMC